MQDTGTHAIDRIMATKPEFLQNDDFLQKLYDEIAADP